MLCNGFITDIIEGVAKAIRRNLKIVQTAVRCFQGPKIIFLRNVFFQLDISYLEAFVFPIGVGNHGTDALQ